MCAYAITYSTLFIFEQKYFDPGEVLYIYESVAGYGLVRDSSCFETIHFSKQGESNKIIGRLSEKLNGFLENN